MSILYFKSVTIMMFSLTLSSKSPASSSGGMDLLVSVGVQAPTEIPRSGNKVMSK